MAWSSAMSACLEVDVGREGVAAVNMPFESAALSRSERWRHVNGRGVTNATLR